MDKPLLAYSTWLTYSADQKRKLIKLFGIPRTGEVVVHVGEMMGGNIGASAMQDGHRPEDLYEITTDKLQEIIGTEDTDFLNMVQHVIDNLDDLYYEKFPEELVAKNLSESLATGESSLPVAAVSEPEAEFVPRDPKELLGKNLYKDGTTIPAESAKELNKIVNDRETILEQPKKKPYAKTSKAKTAKAK